MLPSSHAEHAKHAGRAERAKHAVLAHNACEPSWVLDLFLCSAQSLDVFAHWERPGLLFGHAQLDGWYVLQLGFTFVKLAFWFTFVY